MLEKDRFLFFVRSDKCCQLSAVPLQQYHQQSQQGQIDNEWDAWVADKGWKWNPNSKEILAARAKGPLTRGYGSQFRGTPTGPREAVNPLQDSIAADLSKRRKPEPKPKPEPEPRIWARNRSTKKRMFSDDGGQTWQAE